MKISLKSDCVLFGGSRIKPGLSTGYQLGLQGCHLTLKNFPKKLSVHRIPSLRVWFADPVQYVLSEDFRAK
jgi:hypothetical protein